MDVYSATFENDKWGNVTNMMKTINTSKDDFAFAINPNDSTEGFLSSNRDGDGDQDNIYLVRIFPKVEKIATNSESNAEYINEDSLKKFDGLRYKYNNWDSQKVLYPETIDNIKPVASNTDSTKNNTNPISDDKKIVIPANSDSIKNAKINKPSENTTINTTSKVNNANKPNTGNPPVKQVSQTQNPVVTPIESVKNNTNTKPLANSSKVSFQVQLKASSGYKELKIQNYTDIELAVYFVNATYKLTSGSFPDRASANMHLNKLKQKGYRDAFIVSYSDDLLYKENTNSVPVVQNNTIQTNKNEPNPKKDEPVKNDQTKNNSSFVSGDIVYSVQFLSSEKSIEMKILNDNAFIYLYKGSYRYTPNRFTKTVNEARELKQQLINLGYKDAFIVAFEVKGHEYVRRSDIVVK